MFCMYCGQELPDKAKFCFKCGKPFLTDVSTLMKNETMNLDGSHTFVPAMCPNCSAHMKVDSSTKIARCKSCGTECLVQDAIKYLNVSGTVHVNNANINAIGTNIDSLLERAEIMLEEGDFSGVKQKCEMILDAEPTNYKAYLYMLLSSLGCRKISDLVKQPQRFDQFNYYKNVIKYGDSNIRAELEKYLKLYDERLEAERKKEEEKKELIRRNPSVGDVIEMGKYNGKVLTWHVLDVKKRLALLICTEAVGKMPYHSPGGRGNIEWAECTLRKWLNNDFINAAFSLSDKKQIIPWKLYNANHYTWNNKVTESAPTTDKVFLLSAAEVEHYGQYFLKRDNRSLSTWLRSPCTNTPCVYSYGQLYDKYGKFGLDILADRVSYVIPAMWIKLDQGTNDSSYSDIIEETYAEYSKIDDNKLEKIREEEQKEIAEVKASKREKAKEKTIIAVFIFLRILLMLWTFFASGYALVARKGTFVPLVTVFFLILIFITCIFCELAHEYDWEIWNWTTRAIFAAPIEFSIYSIMIYIFKREYATKSFFGFLFKNVGIVIAILVIGWLIGFILIKKFHIGEKRKN